MKWNSFLKVSILVRNVEVWVLSTIIEIEKLLYDYLCIKGISISIIYIQGFKKEIRSVDATGPQSGCGNNDSSASILKETIRK